MPGKWKRPDSVPYPSVWSRFEGKREINGNIPKFYIQDITPDLYDLAIDTMSANFIYDEPVSKYSGLAGDALSVQALRAAWKEALNDKLGIICFMENPVNDGKPIVAGLNMTYLSEKDEKIPEYKGKQWLKIIGTMVYLCHIKDPFEQLGINEYMSAIGLSVLPEFRGQGIGEELLKARFPLCKAVGLKATLTVFTAGASQRLAEKTGFKDIVSISYDELEKRNPQFRYPGINEHTKIIRYMYKLID